MLVRGDLAHAVVVDLEHDGLALGPEVDLDAGGVGVTGDVGQGPWSMGRRAGFWRTRQSGGGLGLAGAASRMLLLESDLVGCQFALELAPVGFSPGYGRAAGSANGGEFS